jgi:hypothetical protein
VLASKLWGEFAPTFWGMVGLMVAAFWVLVGPKVVPKTAVRIPLFRPRLILPQVSGVVLIGLALVAPQIFPAELLLDNTAVRIVLAIIAVVLLGSASIGAAVWLKEYFVTSLVIASLFVVLGMWLERWNIIIPTVTHPRLVEYTTYLPTMTEIAITAASFSALVLLPLLFFKLFPVISIWEVAEGRVIDAEFAKVTIPLPETSNEERHLRGFRRRRDRSTNF